jgi:signal transduction histidine kinase
MDDGTGDRGASLSADDRAPKPSGGGNRFTVAQWFAIATGLLGAVTLVGLVAGVIAVVRLADARELVVDRLDPAATAALRLSNALLDEETGVRGYALAGELEFLRPYRVGRRQERIALRELRMLVRGTEDLDGISRDLALVERRAEAWRDRYVRGAVARVRAEGPGAVRPAGIERGRRLFGRVRAALGRLGDDIRSARRQGRADLDAAATFLAVAAGVIAALLIAALVTSTILLRRTVTLPIGALARRVRRVAGGDFERRVRSRGPRDIASLAADIDSMRRRILAELSESRAAHAKVDEQARDLERSNAELEQFAYVASHDLQEPLRKVASFTQLLEQRYRGRLDQRADQYIEFAVDGAKRMQRQINDLLAFSRVGRASGALEPVDLGEALRRAVANLDTAIGESGARVDAGELPTVRGEASLLELVFQNLVGNAIKFRSDARTEVRIGAERRDGEWLITCSDNGIGIDPEYAERVFAIFQRLHPKDEYPGTGIGLAMCRKIVEYHGGRIWFEADSGPGTTFRFTLPVLEETG